MISEIVGAGVSAVGSIFGGLQASRAMKEAKKNLEDRRRENKAWYERRYNEDATQRADAQRALALTEQRVKERNRQAAGLQSVVGGTTESVMAATAADNEAMADTASRIAADGASRRDQIEKDYRATDNQFADRLRNMEVQRAGNIATAATEALKAGAGIATSGAFDPKQKPEAKTEDETEAAQLSVRRN